jgi:HD-like signal output (HDOD) protein
VFLDKMANSGGTMYEWFKGLFSGGRKAEPVPEVEKAPVATPVAAPTPNAAAKPGVTSAPPNATSASKAGGVANAAELPRSATTAAPAATTAAATTAAAPAKAASKAGDAWGASWEQRNEANANFNDWLFEVTTESEFSTNAVEDEILDALDKIVKSKQSCVNMVKRLPGLIPQLLQSLRTENFSGADLSRKIAHDPVLVAAVIRLANSSANSLAKSITSIEHAVLILGQAGLRQLITGVAFRPIIDLNSGRFTKNVAPRIWAQSERCALACRMLAEQRGIEPFEAFLAGLVQYVGLVVCLRLMDQHAQGKGEIGSPAFCSALLKHARVLSCSISVEWNFPEAVSKAIEEQGSVFNTALMTPVGKVLSLADYVAKVRMLVDNDRLTQGDPRVLKGLPAEALDVYQKLAEFEDFDPMADAKAS